MTRRLRTGVFPVQATSLALQTDTEAVKYRIGIDVGGTTTTIAIGNDTREVVVVSDQFESRTAEGPQCTSQAILDQIETHLTEIGGTTADIIDVGLATPGPATLDGVLRNTPNLDPALWNGFPFRAALEEKIRQWSPRASVHYIGDGQAAAYGEYSIRSGAVTWNRVGPMAAGPKALSSLFMLIVGTGLGGGQVQDGRVVRGKEGRAGHAGHLLLPPYAFRYEHDQQLRVGNAMCTAESAISLTGLTHQLEYRLTLPQWADHPLQSVAGSTRDKAKSLRGLASQGDALALELFDDQARALGITLLDLNYVGDFDLLIIGGGVCDLSADVKERYKRIAEEAYRQHALDGFRDLDCLEFSSCGDESPVIGALAFAYTAAL
ncbi:Fructokinase [Stieleria neptunia]|uniref:Fructokinase n=1 Tax=Stieleria neptunia TaxID=2527979 RepID=A0A518HYT3_9BACT|nr:ROK family protein [Stieleria neptunia]QDV45999.1 Fructokinase [Stieleria neptunia]